MTKRLTITACLAFLLERLSFAVLALPRPAPALVRKYECANRTIDLALPHHPARTSGSYVLIPKDKFFRDVEDLLGRL